MTHPSPAEYQRLVDLVQDKNGEGVRMRAIIRDLERQLAEAKAALAACQKLLDGRG